MGGGGDIGNGAFSQIFKDFEKGIHERERLRNRGKNLPDMPEWDGSKYSPRDWDIKDAERTDPIRRTEGNSAWRRGKTGGGLANSLRANTVTTGRNTNTRKSKGE